MDLHPSRRRALAAFLAVALAVESVSAVAAVAAVTNRADAGSRQPLPAAVPAGTVLAESARVPSAVRPASLSSGVRPEAPVDPRVGEVRTSDAPSTANLAPAAVRAPRAPRALAVVAPARPATSSSGSATSRATTKPATTKSSGKVAYRGTNHVWIPALGINRSVHSFPCDRVRPPDNYVYRWGCAGHNNVYLLGHAYSVFKPLHDAYVGGRLRVGMKAYYADGSGKVRVYAVKWWKLTAPTTAASWAWAAQSVPSMTLQTCVGANSEYRLMVRLVQVG